MNARAGLLIVAYVLLVFVVAFGAFFVHSEFEKVHDDQCAVSRSMALIVGADILASVDPDLSEDRQERIENALTEAQASIEETC